VAAWALLREARARTGLSQRALAARAHTAQSEIARIENARQDPSYGTLERLVRAAGFDLKLELVPHDDHDERLVEAMLALPVEERLDSLEAQSEFFASAVEVGGSRGALIEALTDHDLRFVIIGGVAERLLGSPRVTDGFDICAATSRANLARLAAVLNELEAHTRSHDTERWNARSFGLYTSIALVTSLGFLDVWFRPDGTNGYDDLIQKAVDVDIAGTIVKVAHIDDILRNKQAIGGPKYLSHLPLLRELKRRRGD